MWLNFLKPNLHVHSFTGMFIEAFPFKCIQLCSCLQQGQLFLPFICCSLNSHQVILPIRNHSELFILLSLLMLLSLHFLVTRFSGGNTQIFLEVHYYASKISKFEAGVDSNPQMGTLCLPNSFSVSTLFLFCVFELPRKEETNENLQIN